MSKHKDTIINNFFEELSTYKDVVDLMSSDRPLTDSEVIYTQRIDVIHDRYVSAYEKIKKELTKKELEEVMKYV